MKLLIQLKSEAGADQAPSATAKFIKTSGNVTCDLLHAESVVSSLAQEKLDDTADSKRTNGSKCPSPPMSEARQGGQACRPLEIRTSRIDSEFHTIKCGMYEGRPACLITVDLTMHYGSRHTLKFGKITIALNRSREEFESLDSTAFFPRLTNVFGPKSAFGAVVEEPREMTFGAQIKPQLHQTELFNAGYGFKKNWAKKRQWELDGRLEESSQYQAYTWSMNENNLASIEESFPRKVAVGFIVEHDNKPFFADINVEAKIRQVSGGFGGRGKKDIDRKLFKPVSSNEKLTEAMLLGILDKMNGGKSADNLQGDS